VRNLEELLAKLTPRQKEKLRQRVAELKKEMREQDKGRK